MNPHDLHHTFLTRPFWNMGQRMAGAIDPRINETATRVRAGLLNTLSATTIALLVAAPQLDPVLYVGPFVIFDMVMAALFGLTPFSPLGLLGTAATMHQRPLWKPSPPKRTAWLLGGTLGIVCLGLRLAQVANGWIIGVLSTCFALTWLEAVMGFCVGCWLHVKIVGCAECEVPYQRATRAVGP